MEELAATLEPRELKYEGKETKTEVKEKLLGKAEIIEKETGNIVLTQTNIKRSPIK
ncbi:hypothetical protein [Pontibacillus litoralis]|uniref:Uncharacterized protein n=1 Tax=Pontibacillus litoralis JSM 072002 TaxID=1385512 RepID=A0A0A5FYU4_9BACI|nr:hypothetical protein [Pontibacillus litoralis]KGX84974.1 hypothetical protein N784_11405 [Pontibacillus litoralis JSM 072002]